MDATNLASLRTAVFIDGAHFSLTCATTSGERIAYAELGVKLAGPTTHAGALR